MTRDKLEAKTGLNCSKLCKSRGKWVTWAFRRESYLSFSVLSSLKKTVSRVRETYGNEVI